MSDNVQKTPIVGGLGARVDSRVRQHVENMAGRAPASIATNQGQSGVSGSGTQGNQAATDPSHTIAWIQFETDGSVTLPQVQMPIHSSEYVRHAWQAGDKGFVGLADFDTGNMTGLGPQTPSAFVRPGNLSALVFHPLGNTNFSATDDKDSHLAYGKAGTIHRDENKVSQVKTSSDASKGATMSTGGDGSGADGPHNMKATSSGTETNTTQTHKTNAPAGHMVSDDQVVGKNITSTSGNITAAIGNVAAPSGQVSGQTGSFPGGGSMGGLSLLSGVLAAASGGGGGGTALSIDTNASAVSAASVTGDVVGARKYVQLPIYTLGALLTALPPGSTFAGARVYVSDLTNAYGYGQVLTNPSTQGGGTNGRCMFCNGTNWVVG